ncbi:DNA gyrase inhibitor YacG [Novosphingobium sp. FSY-8]|uniref:DNA gyrase inhibitor YacG n=1 Tax=Novosphingobium ovatum TaxID=1908523 RepID=A0ABW9XAU6_9SPHN|nr:DNA gyrase inhibitor YacG [Novosphingobium ovatum]NBC35653.1 DNA gyrase inhibitor YacG [Novosphingobium ovatum]
MTQTSTRKCPICGRPRVQAHSPFCSTRCRDKDLVQWLSDGYALPAGPAEEEDSPRPDE